MKIKILIMSQQINIDDIKLGECLDELDIEIGNDNFNILFQKFNIQYSTDDIKNIIKIVGGKKKKNIINYLKAQTFTFTDLENYVKSYSTDNTNIDINLLYQELKNIFNVTFDLDTFKNSIIDKIKPTDIDNIKIEDFNSYVKSLIN